MGKYMRKAKFTGGDVAVMEVVSQSSLGVRTRAKTLALQRLQSTPPPPPVNSDSSYLQLRSRRLEKVLPPLVDAKKQQHRQQQQQPATAIDGCGKNPNPSRTRSGNRSSGTSSRLRSVNLGSFGSVSVSSSKNEEVTLEFATRAGKEDDGMQDFNDFGIEPSFGENDLDVDGRDGTRESTPCSIRESFAVGTPGSTTRQIGSTASNRGIRNSMLSNIPTTHEIDEFFAFAELQHQRLFAEKYNFDIVDELPLPGRYEWVRINY